MNLKNENVAKNYKHGGSYCAVFGCHKRRGRDLLQFFHVKRANYDQTLEWARQINRKNDDGSLWLPKDSDLICSNHFVSGKPDKNPLSYDYKPTIFPTNHVPLVSESVRDRYKRVSFFKSIR